MKSRSFKIPGDLLREFKEDVEIKIDLDGNPLGIYILPEMLRNPELFNKLKNFELVLVPNQFMVEE